MSELKNDLHGFWQGLLGWQRASLIAGLAAIVLLALAVASGMFRTEYKVLFSDLQERDAATVIDELKRAKVPYRLEAGGSRVLVPADAVHETRLAVMSKNGGLRGGIGFEIFDNKDLGMTEYTQKINFQRALQGEIARTVMSIDQVKHARVHLVLPEASLFKRDKSKPKASVTVTLKPDARLNGEQIVGIQRLVSASVPGIDAPMVTVFDQRGVALSASAEADEADGGASQKLRLKREVEDYLTRKAVAVLDRAFGPGQALVSVDATLNFDEIKRTQQEVIPMRTGQTDGGVVVRRRQAVNRQGAEAARAVETDAFAPDSGASQSTAEVEYEFGRRAEEVVTARGGVSRLSVGVVLPKSPNEAQLANVRALVAAAIGLNASRGDAIAVHAIDGLSPAAFNAPAMTPAIAAAAAVQDAPPPAEPMPAPAASTQLDMRVVILLVVAAIVAILAWAAVRWHDARATRRQREQLLREVRQWIEADAAPAGRAL